MCYDHHNQNDINTSTLLIASIKVNSLLNSIDDEFSEGFHQCLAESNISASKNICFCSGNRKTRVKLSTPERKDRAKLNTGNKGSTAHISSLNEKMQNPFDSTSNIIDVYSLNPEERAIVITVATENYYSTITANLQNVKIHLDIVLLRKIVESIDCFISSPVLQTLYLYFMKNTNNHSTLMTTIRKLIGFYSITLNSNELSISFAHKCANEEKISLAPFQFVASPTLLKFMGISYKFPNWNCRLVEIFIDVIKSTFSISKEITDYLKFITTYNTILAEKVRGFNETSKKPGKINIPNPAIEINRSLLPAEHTEKQKINVPLLISKELNSSKEVTGNNESLNLGYNKKETLPFKSIVSSISNNDIMVPLTKRSENQKAEENLSNNPVESSTHNQVNSSCVNHNSKVEAHFCTPKDTDRQYVDVKNEGSTDFGSISAKFSNEVAVGRERGVAAIHDDISNAITQRIDVKSHIKRARKDVKSSVDSKYSVVNKSDFGTYETTIRSPSKYKISPKKMHSNVKTTSSSCVKPTSILKKY